MDKLLLICALLCCLTSEMKAATCLTKPYCSCTGKDVQTIYCRNVRDISDIAGLLKRRTPVYEIRIQGTFSTISSKEALDGISVSVLVLKSPLGFDIPIDSLAGIHGLRTMVLNMTQYQTIPGAFSNRDYVTFESTRGRLNNISDQLKNMSSAAKIRLSKNQISIISEDAFHGTSNVQLLDLSYNDLAYLYPGTLEPMRLLEYIFLEHNHLHSLDGCFATVNPKKINLYGNNLTSIDNVLHGGMWNLEILNVGGNPEMLIPTFNRSMRSLYELHLSYNDFSSLDPYSIKNLWRLRNLYLNGNNLTYIPRYFFEDNPYISVLQLSNNRLRSVQESLESRKFWYNWMKLSLDGNELSSIALANETLLINSLDISRNQISRIMEEDMVALQKVKYLNLSANSLTFLDSHSFKHFNTLENLDLSNNCLSDLNGSLKGLPQLRTLSLRGSVLKHLSDELCSLPRIQKLDLRNNSLQSVHGAFQNMKYIKVLDVAMNNLTTLTSDSFPPFQKISVRITKLHMADNPWACDCRLAWMAHWVRRPGSKLMDEPVCSSPEHLKNKTIRSLNLTDYERWPDDCPEACECVCKAEGDQLHTEVTCVQKGLSEVPKVFPPNVRSVDLRGNVIQSFDGNNIKGLMYLENLNMENNKIEKVQLAFPSKMSSLHLAHNLLRTFPMDEWTDSINKTSLSSNPWICNCNTWLFRNWLIQHNESIVDVHLVRCGAEESPSLRNKLIISLTQQDLCSLISTTGTTILWVFLALLLILCMICFYYWRSLVALIYFCGCTCLKRPEAHDCPYDAFLMYSEDDEQMALGELATGLEDSKHAFKLCIPTRDIPTPRTPEKINACLPQCTKVIVLLSRSFIENQDCKKLLISAMSFSTKSSACRIIFVICGKLPPTPQLDVILRTLMQSCACLRWGQCLFWPRLIYQLPKNTVKNRDYNDPEEQGFLSS